jgi:hypothetical protein
MCKPAVALLAGLVICLASLPAPAGDGFGEGFRLPEGMDFGNSGIVNMKTDAGAKGDGVSDDTAAFKTVLEAGKSAKLGRGPHPKFGVARTIYVPPGTYVLSEPIVWGDKKKFLRGAGPGKTVLKLADGAEGFGNAETPRVFLDTRGKQHFAQNFAQRIVGLTIDVGSGNPGAIALEFHTNNIGGVFNVAIRSSDPHHAGAVGLSLSKGPGPGLIWDVAIDGFDVGIKSTSFLHSMTLARIRLRNQRRAGIEADKQSLFFSHVDFAGDVPLLVMGTGKGGPWVTMAHVAAKATKAVEEAIRVNDGFLLVRELRTDGFGSAIDAGKHGRVEGPHVAKWTPGREWSAFGEDPDPPSMPVDLPPFPDYDDPSEWTIVEASDQLGRDIQQAIDDGATTIFLKPNALGRIEQTIVLRNRVRRILGFQTIYRSAGDWGIGESPQWEGKRSDRGGGPGKPPNFARPLFRVADGEAPVVVLEFFRDSYGSSNWFVDHATKRTVIQMGAGGTYRNTVPGGRAFLIDCGGAGFEVNGPDQRVYFWQVNTESYDWSPHIANRGGLVWICGHKIEKDRTNIGTYDGGWTEVNGAFYYKNRQRVGPAPAAVVENATASYTFRTYGKSYPVLVRETRDGEVRLTRKEEVGSSSMGLYETVHEDSLRRRRQRLED